MNRYQSYFRTVVLACYFVFLFFLLHTGMIRKFINPRLAFLTVLTLVIIGAMILYNLARIAAEHDGRLRGNRESGSGHDHCDHQHPEGVTAGNYLLFVPMLMSMLFAPQSLSYQAGALSQNQAAALPPTGAAIQPAANGNWNLTPAGTAQISNAAGQYSLTPGTAGNGAPADSATVSAGAANEYTQLQIGDIIFDTPKAPKQKLLNSKIKLIGRVFRSPLLKPDEVVLYRMIITCCAADGLPAGVLVKLPQPQQLQADEWVGVEGTLQLLPFDSKLQSIDPLVSMVTPEKIYPYLMATTSYRVAAPHDEYLYP